MALLGGKPLLEFTIKAAVEAQLPGKICLSTDDVKIRVLRRLIFFIFSFSGLGGALTCIKTI